jgi:hypothetical protein
LKDFEKEYGYMPQLNHEANEGQGNGLDSPERIRASMKEPGANHDRAIENMNRLIRDEINKLSGLSYIL